MRKYFIILIIIIISNGFAQDITNKLGGSTATETYDVTDSADNVLFRVQGNGDVGIGVTSPTHVLHVEANESSGAVGHFVNTVTSSYQYGVYGACDNTDFFGHGGYFEGGYTGAYGTVTPNSSVDRSYYGLFGYVETEAAHVGYGYNYGLRGIAKKGKSNFGVRGSAQGETGANNYGVYGYANGISGTPINYGVYGKANGPGTNYAGYFQDGDVKIVNDLDVVGTLSKGGGSFKIDHPLDPENKYLYHSFVESPDMKNIYDGTVITDGNGMAYVELPNYFEALNKDFRYQLTVIGEFAQVIILDKIRNNQFSIKSDKPNVEVSWLVTGIRQDAYANANRIQVEEYKKSANRGKYLHPEAFGRPPEMSVDYRTETAAEMKAAR